jgi:hypothetical protein
VEVTFLGASWLVLLPEPCGAQAWSFSSSLTSFFDHVGREGACIDRMGWDGMGPLHISIVALLNLPWGSTIYGWVNREGWRAYFSLPALRKHILERQSIETTTFCNFFLLL